MNRAQRKITAHQTLKIIENGVYRNALGKEIHIGNEIKKAIQQTKQYSSEELEQLKSNLVLNTKHHTTFSVTHEDSISAVLRLTAEGKKNILCLNFASAKNPGGGFLNGSLAQEESLATSSALYASQQSVFSYYTKHREMKTGMYSDAMILSPNIPVFRNAEGTLLDKYVLCNFITSPAVNKGVIKNREPHLLDTVSTIMRKRIEKLLAICVAQQYETLILGAWGCGVFQNEPETIAQLFYEQLQGTFKNQFKEVVFAIYSKKGKSSNAFQEVFNPIITH
jgi:uncharacterized protein (TIGR02452 family)